MAKTETSGKRTLLTVLVASSVALWVAPAPAAQSDAAADSAAEDTLAVVTVTAGRLREENVQDVPISQTVFTEDMIKDGRLDRVEDFVALTPGVTFRQTQNVGQSFVMIRGLTQVRNNEPPVAVVIDGALTASPNQLARELFDVQSIEVLRGPQGALYGRNATGGAIIIKTREPTNEFDGHIRGGYGTGEEYFIQGGISGPLIDDTLFSSLNAKFLDRAGYYDNVTLNQKADPFQELAVLGKVVWKPTDSLAARLRLNYVKNDATALNVWFQPTILDANNKFAGFDFSPGNPLAAVSPNSADSVFEPLVANNAGFNDREIFETVLKVDKQVGFGSITSITAYQELSEITGADQFPYTAATFLDLGFDGLDGTQTQFLDVESWSQEIRFASKDDTRLRWMLGGYLLLTDRFIGTTAGRDLGEGVVEVRRTPFPNHPTNPTLAFLADDNDNTAWALFGNLTYDVTDRLEAYLGIRYDKDKREQSISPLQFGLPPGVGNPGGLNEVSFGAVQPKASLRYAATDRINVFASWGRGFRSGQFNQSGTADLVANANDVAREENTETFELGFKSQFLENRLTLNGTAFRTNVEDSHYFLFIGALTAQVMVNIDEVDLSGLDLEIAAHLAEGLDFFAGFGYIDSEIKAYAFSPAAVGNEAPYVSRTTLNLSGQYKTPLFGSLIGLARVDYSRNGKRFWDPENTTLNDPIDLLNARLGLEARSGAWVFSLYGKNLLDTAWSPDVTADGGAIFTYLAPPRVYGVDLQFNF